MHRPYVPEHQNITQKKKIECFAPFSFEVPCSQNGAIVLCFPHLCLGRVGRLLLLVFVPAGSCQLLFLFWERSSEFAQVLLSTVFEYWCFTQLYTWLCCHSVWKLMDQWLVYMTFLHKSSIFWQNVSFPDFPDNELPGVDIYVLRILVSKVLHSFSGSS